MWVNEAYEELDDESCALKHLLRYLKGTLDLPLMLRRGTAHYIQLAAYSDADWAGCPENSDTPMRSTSGNVLYLVQIGAIYASSATQKVVALSTAESETIAACECTKKVRAAEEFFTEIGFPQTVNGPIAIKEDKEACIAMSKSILTSLKSRHMKIKHHYVRSQVTAGSVKLVPCPTSDMVADILTKNLERVQFEKLRDILMGVVPYL